MSFIYTLKLGSMMPTALRFPKIALASQSFVVSSKFRGFFFYFSEKKNGIGTLIEVLLNLSMSLGRMNILRISTLSINKCRISFHLFMSSLVSFISVLEFWEYRSFTSLVKFIPKILLLGATVSGIVLFLFHMFYC